MTLAVRPLQRAIDADLQHAWTLQHAATVTAIHGTIAGAARPVAAEVSW